MAKVNFFKDLEEKDCITLEQLHQIKGRGFNPKTVRKWIREGRLVKGKHFIKLPGVTGMYKVSLSAFNQYLEEVQ